MKAKKWLTIITLLFCVVSAVVALCTNKKVYDFFMAIFGSALLGFIMSLIEYFTERRNAMEKFLIAAYKLKNEFYKLKYIDLDDPKDLIIDCIVEEEKNKYYQNLSEKFGKDLSNIDHSKRNYYISWIKENEVLTFLEDENIDEKLLQVYNQRIEVCKKTFDERMDMYIKFGRISIDDLLNAYGNLDFVFGNKTLRTKAYKSIYLKFKEFKGNILSKACFFNMLKEEKTSYNICIKKLFELNDFFFEETKKDECITVHLKPLNDLSDRIEEFKSKAYFTKKIKYKNKIPVYCKYKNDNSKVKWETEFF